VLFSETRNLISKADDAWFEMFATARDQALLKQQAGRDARGRKNTKPVMHYSLSWANTESPSLEHMKETALASLKALGLEGHQAVIAAHGDKQHLHVHIVVNTIHPQTGLTAPLKYSKERLSRWAEAYEREHGIHCQERISNNAERDRAARARDGAALLMLGGLQGDQAKPPYVRVKHVGPNRRQWFAQKELKARMSRLRAELDLTLKAERAVLWEKHEKARAIIDENSNAAADNARAHVQARFKPNWRELYRAQKKELKHVDRGNIFERAVFVFGQRERLGNGKSFSFRQMLPLILDGGKLMDRLDVAHQRERRSLAQIEKAETRIYTDRIWTLHKAKFDRLKEEQARERQAVRDEHFARTRGITLQHAKASLMTELHAGAANANAPSAEQLKASMAEWRKRNDGRDFGREM
jgi:hypothetical protein